MQIKQFPTAQFKLRLKQTAVRNVDFFFKLNPHFLVEEFIWKMCGMLGLEDLNLKRFVFY